MATYLQINNYSTLDADEPPGGCVWYYTQLRDVGISVTEGVAVIFLRKLGCVLHEDM